MPSHRAEGKSASPWTYNLQKKAARASQKLGSSVAA